MNIFLFILIFFVEVKALNKQKPFLSCNREKSLLTSMTDYDDKVEEKLNCDCEQRFGIVQKIVYSKTADFINIPFSSACVRCNLCLVIADKINKTLIDAHDTMSTGDVQWLNNTQVDALLEMICNQSFIGYRLREINGERYIGKSLPGSFLIESTADKLWEMELKNKCIELIQDIGTASVYKYWSEWYFEGRETNLAQTFCQDNQGVYHDCRSFEEHKIKINSLQDKNIHQAKIKTRPTFRCW